MGILIINLICVGTFLLVGVGASILGLLLIFWQFSLSRKGQLISFFELLDIFCAQFFFFIKMGLCVN